MDTNIWALVKVDGLKPFQPLIPSRFKLKVVALLMFGSFFGGVGGGGGAV